MKEELLDCPLLKKKISEGLCLDINFERLDFFDAGTLKDIQAKTGHSRNKINILCENCVYNPFKKRGLVPAKK